MPQRKNRMTYAKAGVDIDAKSEAIASLVKQLRYRRTGRGRMMDIKGQFTSLIDFGDVALTLCTDGVGTKLLIAEALNKWDTVGIDCMAMNVNDTICVGAEPIAFVDYIALDKPNPEVTEAIGIGLQAAAKMSDCEIVGGEIAVLPEMVKGIDLSGSCLGFVEKDRIVTGADIEAGDVIIGLPSSGVHSNGMTLARRVLEKNEIALDQKIPGMRRRTAHPDFHIRPPGAQAPRWHEGHWYGGRDRWRAAQLRALEEGLALRRLQASEAPADFQAPPGAGRDRGQGDVPDLQHGHGLRHRIARGRR
jgi:phosphoribosylaminoimidazole (AIR) synthetase